MLIHPPCLLLNIQYSVLSKILVLADESKSDKVTFVASLEDLNASWIFPSNLNIMMQIYLEVWDKKSNKSFGSKQ